jgi:hypothetical protein
MKEEETMQRNSREKMQAQRHAEKLQRREAREQREAERQREQARRQTSPWGMI